MNPKRVPFISLLPLEREGEGGREGGREGEGEGGRGRGREREGEGGREREGEGEGERRVRVSNQ